MDQVCLGKVVQNIKYVVKIVEALFGPVLFGKVGEDLKSVGGEL